MSELVPGMGVTSSRHVFEEEFEHQYEQYLPGGKIFWGISHISLPCSCEDGGGPWHWAAVQNTHEAISRHMEIEIVLEQLRITSGSRH